MGIQLQLIRFYPEVELKDIDSDKAREILKQMGHHPRQPFTSAYCEDEVLKRDDEDAVALLRDMVYTQFLELLQPAFSLALKRNAQVSILLGVTGTAFGVAYAAAQRVVEILLKKGVASLNEEDGCFRVETDVLADEALLCVSRIKEGFENALRFESEKAKQTFDTMGRQATQLIILQLESFRHPIAWKDLKKGERRSIERPCREALNFMIGARSSEELQGVVPWPFAFFPNVSRSKGEFPDWIKSRL